MDKKSLYIKILRQHEHVMTFCKVTNDSQIIYFKSIIIKWVHHDVNDGSDKFIAGPLLHFPTYS